MPAPTQQVVNLVNDGAQTAYDGQQALNEFLAWVAQAQNAASTPLVATSDWTGESGPVPPLLQNQPIPAIFANFNIAIGMITALLGQPIAGGTVTVGQAFGAMAELAPVRS
jgi:hypothetical protein